MMGPGTFRLVGLDPGLRHTGWGIIDVSGNRLSHVANGAIHSDSDMSLAAFRLFGEQTCELDHEAGLARSSRAEDGQQTRVALIHE